ncbi:formimidoylglutamase [Flaviaesturariibacter aridisoli]|uniref:Arginase n=1 Tax=Flaviaesturariibacter aridisoli TaxID=2545761 RepID=A0A4R4DW71_9BACT|nr:formimidoylglutamase [Flaviaesturariibacter aridisoli]TCZ68070.1 arginase [Flaviaesturariibacter aridisoli]
MQTPHFRFYTKNDILALTKIRRFETKLGEQVHVLTEDHGPEAFQKIDARYVVLGIPEDIGVQANAGTGGAATGWTAFLHSFLNIQSNDFLTGDDICVAGHFDFSDMQKLIEANAQSEDERIEAFRHAVNTIDEEVEKIVKAIVSSGKVPVVIGGGHNNAYPLLKGSAKGLHQDLQIGLPQINAINLDAHTDYRPAEGRHSGNGFRYAEDDGFLQKYCVVGIHENYLQQNVWVDIVNNPFFDCITYEDIFIHGKRTFQQAIAHAIEFTDDTWCGIEVDLDAVQGALTSAATPSGLLPLHARQFINLCAGNAKCAYLHICEGAVRLSNGRTDESTGKLIAYLVSDFIKMHSAEKQ